MLVQVLTGLTGVIQSIHRTPSRDVVQARFQIKVSRLPLPFYLKHGVGHTKLSKKVATGKLNRIVEGAHSVFSAERMPPHDTVPVPASGRCAAMLPLARTANAPAPCTVPNVFSTNSSSGAS